MQSKTERFELRLDPQTIERLDDWRAEQPDLPSRSEAVRRLVDAGLGSQAQRQLFEMARFQLLSAALSAGTAEHISDSCVFAWDRGVYPLFDSGARLHEPFESNFRVDQRMLTELSSFLDSRWLAKSVPTFYELEDHYEVRMGRSEWDRSTLIAACRYMFLAKLFDADFWSTLLTATRHPSEAASVAMTYDRATDIYLA